MAKPARAATTTPEKLMENKLLPMVPMTNDGSTGETNNRSSVSPPEQTISDQPK
jgi:hypothetical protein